MYTLTFFVVLLTSFLTSIRLPKYIKNLSLILALVWLSLFVGLRLSGWDADFYSTLNFDATTYPLSSLFYKYQLISFYRIESGYLIWLKICSFCDSKFC